MLTLWTKPILALFATTVVALTLAGGTVARAGGLAKDQVCDVTADSYLGLEDYNQAIKLHLRISAAHPQNALAHYHLGFAYGMVGQHDKELAEYRSAVELRLNHWDLYVNLGRVYLESGNFPAATDALLTAVALGPNHPEAHFNLGLAYERRRMLPPAEHEMRSALRLDPGEPEASNMLGVICAEEGDYLQAHQIWMNLTRSQPDFAPARANLAMLDRANHAAAPTLLTEQPVFVDARARP
jgi:tetratricopeptide (TPR) repeat protein